MPERVIEETFDQVEDVSLLSQHANSMFCPYLCALLSLPPSLVVFVKVAPPRLAMVKAEDVPKDDFMTKLSEVTGDDAKSRSTLKALREQDSIVDIDDSENKKIVAALSALGVARVNLSAFQSWKEKIRVTETTEHVIWIVKKLSAMGVMSCRLRTDPEEAMVALAKQVKNPWAGKMILEKTPVASHQSTSGVERFHRMIQDHVRTIKIESEQASQAEIASGLPVVTWIVRHAS